MASKVSTLSDLIHRVIASNCLTHTQLLQDRYPQEEEDDDEEKAFGQAGGEDATGGSPKAVGDGEESHVEETQEERKSETGANAGSVEREELMEEVFDAVAEMKRAYVRLQRAHSPWDADLLRSADESVVSELRRLGRLRNKFHRGRRSPGALPAPSRPLMEAVAPYEAALLEARAEIKVKQAEIESLKDKLQLLRTTPTKRGRRHNKKASASSALVPASALPAAPTPELFESCVEQVKLASKSFSSHLISLMRSARWDLAGAVRSLASTASPVDLQHARHVIESYVSRKLFHGFENESFYMEGSLSSLLDPEQHRRRCYAELRDMRAMDPSELLGILPTCRFGKWAAKKYLSIVDARMEESLLGAAAGIRRRVEAGEHPRTGFYGEYLRLAKAVWLVHRLAFALEPGPSHFEATAGAGFDPGYMESVVKFPGGRVPDGWVVGFSVGPGFNLRDGSVVKARVYPVPTGEQQTVA